MAASDEVASFIGASFRSVWALELLLLLKREGRSCRTDELVSMMRASLFIVENAVDALIASGLADRDSTGTFYMPVNANIAALVDETERLYSTRPNRVRRLIIATSHKGLTAFSDAFRLKD